MRRLTIALIAVVLLAVVYMFATGQWRVRSEAIPPELIGVWSTTAPSHADRPFQITDSTLVLHTGGTDSTVAAITDVRGDNISDGVAYTLEYLVEGEAFLFSFSLTGGPDGVIRFRNQPAMEWRKRR